MHAGKKPNKVSAWRSIGRFLAFTLLGAATCAFVVFVINHFFPVSSNSGLDIAGGLIRAYITIAVAALAVLIPRIYYGRSYLQETWGQSIGYAFLYLILISVIASVLFYVHLFLYVI